MIRKRSLSGVHILVMIGGFLWLGLLLPACGMARSGEMEQTVSTGSEALTLEEAAQLEGGELMFYTSMSIDDLEQILAEFKETYPFVKADYYRSHGDVVMQKAFTEAQAGQHFADVFDIQAFEVYLMQDAQLLQPYVAPESGIYPDNAKDPDGYWTVARISTLVIGYNTDLVDPRDVPTTWQDLLDPKWKGLIGVESDDVELFANMASVWGDEKAIAFWEGIAALEPGMVTGHTELAELVSAGEFAISPTLYGYRVEKLKAKGAPLEWVRTDPVIAYSEMIAMAANAPHPATAKLFINWMLSVEGQKVIRDLGRIPMRPGVDPDPPELTKDLNLVITLPSLAARYDEYAEKWKSIFNLE